MSMPLRPEKLYCYVDETGQDTLGRLFVVAILVTGQEREALEVFLGRCEQQSGRGRRKWTHTRKAEKQRHLQLAFTPAHLRGRLFYRVYRESKEYLDLTALAIVQALYWYAADHHITDYKAVVLIDGLNRRGQRQVSKLLRTRGVRTRAVKGVRDEASAMIRLADTVAGLVRDALEGDEELTKWVDWLAQEQILTEL